MGKKKERPNLVSEEDEPRNIEKERTEEKNSIGTPKFLTATLNGHQSEQCNPQIYQQNPVVQCSQRSNQRAPNLRFFSTLL